MWERIVQKKMPSIKVVNYTIRPGACPVSTWYAIAQLNLPHHGAPHTQRTEWCRAKLDLDGEVLAIWDWVDRKWVDTKVAIAIVKAQNTMKEMA